MSGRVVVVGAVNHDVLLRVRAQARPGETVLARSSLEVSGGKGANQACAAARLGASTLLVACVGTDREGTVALESLAAAGVDCSMVARIDGPTGRAYVQVSDDGESTIVVAPEANSHLSPDFVGQQLARLALTASDVVLISLEITMPAAERAARYAVTAGAVTVVNPAPARALPDSLVRGVVLTPNEHEVGVIATGAEQLLARGAVAVVTTRGRAGCRVHSPSGDREVAALEVRVVDTTGAGDTFNGALASRLVGSGQLSDPELLEACAFAAVAASLSTRVRGARGGQPTVAEVRAAMG
jgi:ribokinase